MGDLTGEVLLGVLGVDPFLGEPRPIRITQRVQEDALSMAVRWNRQIRRFLTRDDWSPEGDLPPFDFDKLSEDLTTLETPDALQTRIQGVGDPDVFLALAMEAQRALDYLREHRPTRTRITAMGPVQGRPSDAEIGAWRRKYHVVNNPESILDELLEGDLTRAQVACFKEVYPTLYDLVFRLVAHNLTRLKTERPNFQLDRDREKQLLALLMAPGWDTGLSQRLQEAHRQPDPAAQREGGGGGGPVKLGGAAEQTQTQRITAR